MINVYFEAIIPKPFNVGILRLDMLNEARKIRTQVRKDFKRTVQTWNTKPKFETEVGFTQDILSFGVFTEDENYIGVSEGRKAKPRVARGGAPGGSGAKALTLIPYASKTTVGEIDSHKGGQIKGEPIIFRRYALDSGKSEPRKFDVLIAEEWEDKFPEQMQEALDRAAVKTGYTF